MTWRVNEFLRLNSHAKFSNKVDVACCLYLSRKILKRGRSCYLYVVCNYSIVFIFVSFKEKGFHCVVSVGQLIFDFRSYCGLSRRMQGTCYELHAMLLMYSRCLYLVFVIPPLQNNDIPKLQNIWKRHFSIKCISRCSTTTKKQIWSSNQSNQSMLSLTIIP